MSTTIKNFFDRQKHDLNVKSNDEGEARREKAV